MTTNSKVSILVVAVDNTDKTITAWVDETKYEYWVRGNFLGVEALVRQYLRVGAPGKALNVLKKNSYRVDKLTA